MSRRTPFDDIERLIDRMGEQFEDASRQWGGLNPQQLSGASSIDVVDRGDAFDVRADLPGFEPDDVDFRVVDQTLHLDAARSDEVSTEDGEFVHQERTSKSISRRVRLPEPVDADDVTATLEQGVLSVTIPKAAPDSTGHSIDIE
ncbi:HSP20 family protein [Halomicrobium zhouii]|uniref:HSP20 family protein n=1 Tax=Halomicrobium zhouii TaxID=767519 RepID=A0A1I6KK86_9EURY|nr:Hsp20/alpha crystallin family protein [Halomicrobium zhouii]SFR91617.1 HSP20 family protein [Halomicrobium zhouii]